MATQPYVEISAEEAKKSLMAGTILENCRIPFLDLGSDSNLVVYEKAVILRRCWIQGLTLAGAQFRGEVRIEGSIVAGNLWAGALREDATSPASKEKRAPAVFDSCCILLGSGIEGDVDMVRSTGKSWNLTRVTVDGQIRAMGMGLQGRWDASQFMFKRGMDFRGARITGGLVLEKGKSEGALLFAKVKTSGGIRLKNTQVVGNVDVSEVSSPEATLTLQHLELQGDLHCGDALWQELVWEKVQCLGDVRGQRLRVTKDWCAKELSCKSLGLRYAQFGNAKLDNCHIQNKWSLDHGRVSGDLHVVNSRLTNVDWYSMEVKGEIYCHKCQFAENFDAKKIKITGPLLLRNDEITGAVNMEQAELGKLSLRSSSCHNNVSFFWAVIEGKMDLGATTMEGDLNLRGVTVKGLAIFFNSKFKGIDITGAEFQNEVLFLRPEVWQHFSDIPEELRQPAELSGPLIMVNARFQDVASWEQVKFGAGVEGREANFQKDVNFRGAQIAGDLDLRRIHAASNLDLCNSKIQGCLSLDESDIHRKLDATGCIFAKISFPHALIDHFAIAYEQLVAHELVAQRLVNTQSAESLIKSRSEFLILRDAFAQMGHHDAQDWAHWQFKRMERKVTNRRAYKTLREGRGLLARIGAIWTLLRNLFVRLVLDAGSGYGTQPLRVAGLAMVIICLFAVLYSFHADQIVFSDIARGGTQNFWLSLYFSTITFTTMGVGNVYPCTEGWLKYPVSCEALLGMVLMTLFVGTWTRKIIR